MGPPNIIPICKSQRYVEKGSLSCPEKKKGSLSCSQKSAFLEKKKKGVILSMKKSVERGIF